MNVQQASERLECSVSTVYNLITRRLLGHRRVGVGRGKVVIAEADIEEFLHRNQIEPFSAPRLKCRS